MGDKCINAQRQPDHRAHKDDQTEDSDKQSRKVAARQHSLQFSQQGVTYSTSLKFGSVKVVFYDRAIYLEVCCQKCHLALSPIGTFRTSRDVRLESGMRIKADVRHPLRIYAFTP
jgi:hypothetical protein